MYSVVLLMALGGGAESPALGHRDSCSGCTGYTSCSGCCGGYVVSCGGCSGCCGGCSGGATYSACTGCAGCSGDCHGGSRHRFFGKRRHAHDSCHGCCGGCHGTVISYDTCGGSWGCSGPAVVPATPSVNEAPKQEVAPMPKGKTEEVRSPAPPLDVATFVTERTSAFQALPPAAPTEPQSLGSRLWGRLRGASAP